MIDTIILSLPSFTILKPEKFTPSLENYEMHRFGGRPYLTYVQNPTKLELREGNYKPRLTAIKRAIPGAYAQTLKVEFSAPKLLFDNNFDEVSESDFPAVIEKLRAKLQEMGIGVFSHQLENAKVAGIHYSKNFAFTDGTTASMILRELAKIDLTKRLDLNKTHFRNGGHALYYYARSFSVVFYDKMRDLKVPEARAVEDDREIQLGLFDRFEKKNPFEVLRMEARLCDNKKIQSLLKTIGKTRDTTFKELFNKEVAEGILKLYWQEILDNLSFLEFSSSEPIDFAETIMKNNPKLNLKTALSNFGALSLISNAGARRFRQLINERFSDRSWQRLKRNLKGINLLPIDKYKPIKEMNWTLSEFQPFKLKDFDLSFDKVYSDKR
jgi:hypothetical protein